jgi:hypothetical protein
MKNSTIPFYKNGYNGKIKVAKNQKVIQIHKIQNGINFEANYKALATLTEHGYILYMYLLMHSNDRIWALSSKDVTARTPLTMNPYNAAVHDLIEKGYLVKKDIDHMEYHFSENAYHFLEDPDNKEIQKSLTPESEANGCA